MLDYSNAAIKTDEKGYLILPNTASLSDAKKEVSFYPEAEIKEGRNVIGKISYTYDGMYVGGADIIFDNIKTPSLVHTSINLEPTPTPAAGESQAESSDRSFRPLIIGLIVGFFVLIIGLYFVLVELPRIKRRNAYYKRRAERKKYLDDNYLDL